MRHMLVAALVLLGAAARVPARPPVNQLVYFSQQGCPACLAWDHDIGRIYAKTDEAKALPLRRVDIDAPRPADLQNIEGIHYTPTFVVLHCGREVARIIGYTSDFQFWGLLDRAEQELPKGDACP